MAPIRFGPAFKALALCLFVAGSGLGYVWQKTQIAKLSERMKQCESRYDKLRRNNDKLSQVLARLQTPSQIEEKIRELRLGLVAPQPDQIVRLIEPEAMADYQPVFANPMLATESARASNRRYYVNKGPASK